jgi:Tfp pilus assembly protein PilO
MALAAEKGKMLQFQAGDSTDHDKEARSVPEQILKEIRKDMGKVAILISILAVVLMVIFFFSLQHSMTGLDKRVTELSSMKEDVASMKQRLAQLENLPQQMKNILYSNMLNEMSLKANYLSEQLDGKGKTQITEAQKLLQQAQEGLKQ